LGQNQAVGLWNGFQFEDGAPEPYPWFWIRPRLE